MNPFSRWQHLVTGRRATLVALSFVVVSVLWFRLGPAAELAATGLPLPDTWTGYTPDQLHRTLDEFGETGRRLYTAFLLGDLFYPLFFAAAAGSILIVALRSLGRLEGPGRWLLVLPLLVLVLDWTENVSLLWLVSRFPARFDELAHFTAAVTAVKLGAIRLTLILIVIAIGTLIVSLLRGRTAPPNQPRRQ